MLEHKTDKFLHSEDIIVDLESDGASGLVGHDIIEWEALLELLDGRVGYLSMAVT